MDEWKGRGGEGEGLYWAEAWEEERLTDGMGRNGNERSRQRGGEGRGC